MNRPKQKRNRGVLLTPQGLEELEIARVSWERDKNFGERYTYERISELTNLDINTIKRILAREEKVDKRSLEKFFFAFGLKLNRQQYTKFNPDIRQDWGEAVSVDLFLGRTTELETLTTWLIEDRCRLVAIQGMGGIGKTTLSVELARQIKDRFDCIIWKSLRDAPPIAAILASLIEFLSPGQETAGHLPKTISERITKLIDYLCTKRCLIVLDNAESVLDSKVRAGQYRQGYEEYGEFLTRVGSTNHNSCLILTTREKPKEIAALEGERLAVRSLLLQGLKEGILEIFKLKGLDAPESELKILSDRYGGNPLALKVVATTIKDLFEDNIAEFLAQEKAVFGDIQDILEQQFERLSHLERETMYWLAISREPVSIKELQADFVVKRSSVKLLEALESLSRRSLIESNTNGFTQQPVVMEYITSRLIELSFREIVSQKFEILENHSLIKANAKEYIKENQHRLILQPAIDELLTFFNSKSDIANCLNQILSTLQQTSPLKKGYAAGNIINLLCQMKTDLTKSDFSNLCVWQADLRQVKLHNVNFQNADLSKSVFAENFGGIWSVAFSPDGQYLAAGDTKGDIILRRVSDGQPIRHFTGHSGWVVSLDFSPDGKTLASGSCDCTAKLWDVNTGQCLHSLEEHEHEVWSVAFSPDGKTLATGCDDNKARLWDVATGKCIKVFQEHTDYVLSVVFSLDGKELLSGSHDTTIKLWNIETGECKRTFKGHEDGVRSVSLSPNGQILASSSNDRTIRLWNLETGGCLDLLEGHYNIVMSVIFAPQGNLLASSSMGHKVRLWDINTGECLKVFQDHSNIVNSLAFDSSGDILASGSYDQSVKLWNVNTYQCIKTWQGYSNQDLSVVFSPDGKSLISGRQDRQIRLWDIETERVVKTLRGHANWVFSIAFSQKYNVLASGSGDKTIKLWNASTGKPIKTFYGHEAAVKSVAFGADDRILASGSDDRTIKLWDVKTTQMLKTLQGHQAEIWSIAFSNNGKILASASFDKTVKLWDVSTGKCLETLEDHASWVISVAFSPDNNTLASTSSDQTIKIWNLKTARCINTIRENIGYSQLVAFSVDGQIIASFNGEHNIRLWQVSTGKCLKTLSGHTALINSIAFSSDNLSLASSSEDETIRIWNLETGQCLKTLRGKNPYENMNLNNVSGLTESTIETLKILGAVNN
ncbi:pentapeptide repeat-containing protein [Waterburya agarophytonicola K14]|uniref:Pentapeptide repeat-containing protein n=1 Tax=Waterburya agarophytonicola KI4 TaxID=2874699 RepID=A0A964FH62_9CYAN|nr:NB-ARC domain-containing protein [Waterburya agarophytonicola]MCC0177178.1 pentapeptide repeat-containing protein [Waterburya agarophytonicola KI4]